MEYILSLNNPYSLSFVNRYNNLLNEAEANKVLLVEQTYIRPLLAGCIAFFDTEILVKRNIEPCNRKINIYESIIFCP